jgi:L-amino acid N-acyltransferase YncA
VRRLVTLMAHSSIVHDSMVPQTANPKLRHP